MWKEVLTLWGKAIRFQIVNFFKILPILPFLLLPFIGNLLHSIIVRQFFSAQKIDRKKALKIVWPLLWPYFKIKMRFTAITTITDPLPLIDEMVEIRYAQYAAMISNVMVFENLVGKPCIIRAKEIVRGNGLAVRATVTAPVLLSVAVLILWVAFITVYQPTLLIPFSVFIILMFYICGPLGGTTNSLLYLYLTSALDFDRVFNAPRAELFTK